MPISVKRRMARHPLPPKDHLAAIGGVAAYWTAIESIMETTILGLYEIDPGRGLVLTNNLTFHARMSLLRILAGGGAITDAALAEEMLAILARIDTGFGERNAIVHGLWGPTKKPGVVRRYSIRARGKKLQTLAEDYSAMSLWEVVDRLGMLLRDFADLGERLGIPERLNAAPRHSTMSK